MRRHSEYLGTLNLCGLFIVLRRTRGLACVYTFF